MAPGRIDPRVSQEPSDCDEQWESNAEWDSNEATHSEWDSNGERATDEEWKSNNEWDFKFLNLEEVPASATEEPATEKPEPAFTEEAPGSPSTRVASEEASLPNEEDDSAANFVPSQADKTLKLAQQDIENEVQHPEEETGVQIEPVEAKVPREGPKLTSEEQNIKDREAWQREVAERKSRYREHQIIKDERARKLFEEKRKEENLRALQNGRERENQSETRVKTGQEEKQTKEAAASAAAEPSNDFDSYQDTEVATQEWEESEDGAEVESQEWNEELEGVQDLQKEESEESSADGEDNDANADEDIGASKEAEDSPVVSGKSNARYGNHFGWFPSMVFHNEIDAPQATAPVVAIPIVAATVPIATATPTAVVIEVSALTTAESTPTVTGSASAAQPTTSSTEYAQIKASHSRISDNIRSSRVKQPVLFTAKVHSKNDDETDASITPTPTAPLSTTATTAAAIPSISLTPNERKNANKTFKSKDPESTMSKEAAKREKKQRQKARKEARRRAKSLRKIKIARKKDKERARKEADRKAIREKANYQAPRVPQHVRRAVPPLDVSHPVTRIGAHGVKEEEQRWRSGEGRTSDADREAAARGIAEVARQTEMERQQGVERAETAAARLAEEGGGAANPNLDHDSYDPARAHVSGEEAAVRGPVHRGVGDVAPELGNLGVGMAILVWIAVIVGILRCQRRRGEGGGRGFWGRGRKKRQSEEQGREKLDV